MNLEDLNAALYFIARFQINFKSDWRAMLIKLFIIVETVQFQLDWMHNWINTGSCDVHSKCPEGANVLWVLVPVSFLGISFVCVVCALI